jgi:hypothetical protein
MVCRSGLSERDFSPPVPGAIRSRALRRGPPGGSCARLRCSGVKPMASRLRPRQPRAQCNSFPLTGALVWFPL